MGQSTKKFRRADRLICDEGLRRVDTLEYFTSQGYDPQSYVTLPPLEQFPGSLFGLLRRAKDAPPDVKPFALVIALQGEEAGHLVPLTDYEFDMLPRIAGTLIATIAAQPTSAFQAGAKFVMNPRMNRAARRRLQRRGGLS